MQSLPFKTSSDYSLGVELELQIINPKTFNLASQAKKLVRSVQNTSFEKIIKPEITQSMLEINTSVHFSPQALYQELVEIRTFLNGEAKQFNVQFSGGGTHPFQKWILRKIFPEPRYKDVSNKFQYLAKQATVFGLHVHVGCGSSEKALYLTHMLIRYCPQLIAISASSPFNEGVDTGFDSCRLTLFNRFPLSGTIPYLTDWQSFSEYFYKMKKLGIAQSMKDYYWDIRPKPEFGTVEVRVCDTPLTLRQVLLITAYLQTLAHYILEGKPVKISPEIYTFYPYNRFQAARYGLDAKIINPYKLQSIALLEDILATIEAIKPTASLLGNRDLLQELQQIIMQKKNDTNLLRDLFVRTGNLRDVVREQCKLWQV